MSTSHKCLLKHSQAPKILLIDSKSDRREQVFQNFVKLGFGIYATSSAIKGMRYFAKQDFDAIVVDTDNSIFTAAQTISFIRQELERLGKSAKIVLVTDDYQKTKDDLIVRSKQTKIIDKQCKLGGTTAAKVRLSLQAQ